MGSTVVDFLGAMGTTMTFFVSEVDLITKSTVDMSILVVCHVDRGVDLALDYINSSIHQIDCGVITSELSFLVM